MKKRRTTFAPVLEEGRHTGAFVFTDALATAHTLLGASKPSLPYGLSGREPGKREGVEEQAARIADLPPNGLLARAGSVRRGGST